jgi:hypothetical protein
VLAKEITPTTGRLPYLFGLYVFVAMVVGRLCALIGDVAVTGLADGLLWVLVGIFILRWFLVYTDAVAAADKGRKQLAVDRYDDVRHHGDACPGPNRDQI